MVGIDVASRQLLIMVALGIFLRNTVIVTLGMLMNIVIDTTRRQMSYRGVTYGYNLTQDTVPNRRRVESHKSLDFEE